MIAAGRGVGLQGRVVLDAAPSLALDPLKAISQYRHDVWQTDQGLPQNSVNAILQTRDGYLWLGTYQGLVRFDGQRFTVFQTGSTPELRSNRILALCEDQDGALWIGTSAGARLRGEQLRILLAAIVLLVCAKLGHDLVVKPEDLYSLGAVGRD